MNQQRFGACWELGCSNGELTAALATRCTRILATDGSARAVGEARPRLQLPLVSDRDYTLRTRNEVWQGDQGRIYRIRWEPANDLGPARKPGVQRVNICDGGWLLEPNGDDSTRATYVIYTDSGGAIPPFIANNGSRVAIRKVFEAIRKQVKDPKYTAAALNLVEVRNRGAE